MSKILELEFTEALFNSNNSKLLLINLKFNPKHASLGPYVDIYGQSL